MILFQIVFDLIAWLSTNWREATVFTAISALCVAVAKRIGLKQLQHLLKLDRSETSYYVANQQRIESKIDAILAKEGIEWSPSNLQLNGLMPTPPQPLRRLFLLLPKGISLAHLLRRKKTMVRLKSRKLWVALIGAVLAVLNDQLGWGLNEETILGVIGIAMTYILGQSHVDGKKAASQTLIIGNGGPTNGDSQLTAADQPTK